MLVMPPVAPMLAKPAGQLPEGPDSFEPKWDGFRTIVFRDGDRVELGSRKERPLTRYFPELVAAIRENLPGRCVIDGEIVVPGQDGRRLARTRSARCCSGCTPMRVSWPASGWSGRSRWRGVGSCWSSCNRW